MARYIRTDELLATARDGYHSDFGRSMADLTSLREVIEDTPTADVVEVVRCKDCIYKTVTKDGEYNPEDIVCEYHMSDGFDSDDYCSYGKRKKVE
jgi:hypothetical protein